MNDNAGGKLPDEVTNARKAMIAAGKAVADAKKVLDNADKVLDDACKAYNAAISRSRSGTAKD